MSTKLMVSVMPFLVGVCAAAERGGDYLCYTASSEGVDLPENLAAYTGAKPDFSWGIGSPLQSAFTEYVWLKDDGTIHTWGLESGAHDYPSLAKYLEAVLEEIS